MRLLCQMNLFTTILVLVSLLYRVSGNARCAQPIGFGFNLNPAMFQDYDNVVSAMNCIRGWKCNLPRKVKRFLRVAGPMLLLCGVCPQQCECNGKQENAFREIIYDTSKRYPLMFESTYVYVSKKYRYIIQCPHAQ